jgi:transcriptional regulator with XRE-family HTH domain
MGSVLAFRPGNLMESEPKTFGDWLREKRDAAGLSLQHVADRMTHSGYPISKQRLHDIENNKPRTKGGRPPRPTELQVDAIAAAVFAPVDEARLAARLAPQNSDQTNILQVRLIGFFRELPADQQAAALAMIESLWRQQQAKQRAEKKETKAVKKKRTS